MQILDSGEIRTRASEETGAENQRLRPLGHTTYDYTHSDCTQLEWLTRTMNKVTQRNIFIPYNIRKVAKVISSTELYFDGATPAYC